MGVFFGLFAFAFYLSCVAFGSDGGGSASAVYPAGRLGRCGKMDAVGAAVVHYVQIVVMLVGVGFMGFQGKLALEGMVVGIGD